MKDGVESLYDPPVSQGDKGSLLPRREGWVWSSRVSSRRESWSKIPVPEISGHLDLSLNLYNRGQTLEPEIVDSDSCPGGISLLDPRSPRNRWVGTGASGHKEPTNVL